MPQGVTSKLHNLAIPTIATVNTLAISDFNPLYSDREFAQAHGLRDVMAPPTLLCDT